MSRWEDLFVVYANPDVNKDSAESHMKFAQRHELPFILFSDPERNVHTNGCKVLLE